MRYLTSFLVLSALAICVPAYASEYVINQTEEIHPTFSISGDLEERQVILGELLEYPHLYQFEASKSFVLSATLSRPDLGVEPQVLSGIVVKVRDGGGVTEIGRFGASVSSWKKQTDSISRVDYLVGETFEEPLAPGAYRLEVSSPDNLGQYRLVFGSVDSKGSYFENVGNGISARSFHGLSVWGILLTKQVYYPLGILVVVGLIYLTWLWQKRQKRAVGELGANTESLE